MAAALIALVMLDTALTGWALARVSTIQKVVAQLGEIQQLHDHDLGEIAKRIPGPSEGML